MSLLSPIPPSHRPSSILFFFNDTATTEIYTLSLHDALPISGVQSGCSCTSSADEPATCGVAMLVPWNMAKPLPGTDEKTFTPGAQTSGLISSRLAGPRLEKPARKFWLFVRTSMSVAPFAVAFCPASARIAARSPSPTITPEIVGWFSVPSCPIAVGSPATLFTTTAPTAPALCAFRIFVENVQVPRSSTTMLPAKALPVTAAYALEGQGGPVV